jgi:hypothetical protein
MKNHHPTNRWQNWAENVSAEPTLLLAPTNKEEILQLIQMARAEQRKVRVAGSGHSWSPLVPTRDVMVQMHHFNQLSLNEDKTLVTMQAGVTVDQLAQFLLDNEVCVPSNVGIGLGEAQYGGIISTGCHGSGIQMPSISDWIMEFELISSDGEIKVFSQEKDGSRVMNALRLSLGMCGVIFSMKLKVQPMFNVHVAESKEPLDATLAGLKQLVLGNDYAEVSWMPFNDGVWVQKANTTQEPITRNGFLPPTNAFRDKLYEAGSALALDMLQVSPELTPELLKTSFQVLEPGDYVSRITHFLHNGDYRFFLDRYKLSDIEVVFDIDENFDSVRKAFEITAQKVEQWKSMGRYPLNATLGFRFIKNSAALLSPARDNTYTCMIEIFSYYKTDLFEVFAGEVATAWMKELPRARPHWAKGFQFMPEAIPLMREAFGEQFAEFLAVREELGVDPHNMFTNDFLQKLFALRTNER